MTKPKNYISYTAASETLKRLFGDYDSDTISLKQVYDAAGRSDIDENTNRNWLNNKMNQLKHHNLVLPDNTFDSQSRRHKLTGIRLTLAGKKALGRVDSDFENTTDFTGTTSSSTSLSDVAQAVKAFQKSNPEFEVIFDVKFKGVQPTK